jgi:hypothetical protein
MRRIATARGVYLLRLVSELEPAGDAAGVTIALERADGIEKFALRCLISAAQLPNEPDEAAIEARLEQWLVPGFEQIREAALRSIRSEHRLWEARLVGSN